MALVIKIEEKAEISNRELIKHIENMEDKDRIWFIDRLNKMDTFSKEIWHFVTSVLKLSRRDLKEHQINQLLNKINEAERVLWAKLKKLRDEHPTKSNNEAYPGKG